MRDGREPSGDLVHELVNLLGVVITHAQLARFSQNEAGRRQSLKEIEKAAREAVELLNGASPSGG